MLGSGAGQGAEVLMPFFEGWKLPFSWAEIRVASGLSCCLASSFAAHFCSLEREVLEHSWLQPQGMEIAAVPPKLIAAVTLRVHGLKSPFLGQKGQEII